MRNDELNKIWRDIETREGNRDRVYQRMIYVDLLYRAYIGSAGIPAKRFLSIEIPQNKKKEFDAFTAPKGFTLEIRNPIVKHDGYVACILQTASSDQNDIFTILAKDIIDDLRRQRDSEFYIASLKGRIEKWREFFKNISSNRLTDTTVIGLIGELSFIEQLWNKGIRIASDLWNGPIKAAQDFQGNEVAIEVKTSSSNCLDYVNISSETQLDDIDRKSLFLVVFRVERNDATGITLPALISRIDALLSEQQRTSFHAKLTCLGYLGKDAEYYQKGYSLKEQRVYKVIKGFPRLVQKDLPMGISNIRYKLSLQNCEDYISDVETIVETIKEYEYGEG